MVIFTSICANYAHKARTLAESVKCNIPDAIFVVCLVEQEESPKLQHPCFDRIVLAKDAWEGNFERFMFKHRIVEASTAVKAQFFCYLYKEYPSESKFIYLDPDVYVYDDFSELRDLLDSRAIVVCPHLLEPGNIDMELSSIAHGVYNLGFLAVNRSAEALYFIKWWAQRLYLFCYDSIEEGIFTDQKWIDLAPCFFDVEIFKHKGYDFGTWSLLNCGMTQKNGKTYVKGEPLRFIHFSGYGGTIEKCIRDWLPAGDHPFKRLYADYCTKHAINDSDAVSDTVWSYSMYSSGEKIDDAIRIAYRKDSGIMFSLENPFDLSNQILSEKLNLQKPFIITEGKITKMWRLLKTQGLCHLFKRIWHKCVK